MNDEVLLEDDPARYWEMMFKNLAQENSRLMERLVKLEDLLRWRDAWGEPPTENGQYLAINLEFDGSKNYTIADWNGTWPKYLTVLYWRPIGPPPTTT